MPALIVGHQKGRDTRQRQFRNFGMPKPEGYRKAIRAMKLAEKFERPIFSFIDTPGAYPGIDAEERGQAEAIAYNLREMTKLTVPVIVTVIGEGGSGGALAIGVGDQVLMLENAIYSVISPEGCAAILWKDSSQAARAAEELRLTAQDLRHEGIVDQVIDEPKGGAQNSHDEAARLLDSVLCERLAESVTDNVEQRLARRYSAANELHVSRMDLERMPWLAVAVGPFLNTQPALNVNWSAARQVLRRCFRLPSPQRNAKPSGNVIAFAGVAIFSPFVSRQTEAANGRALRCIAQLWITAEVADQNDFVKRHLRSPVVVVLDGSQES
jgi:acetyl-CoA carboxylase carboxyl transferase subunit alpha